jgi:hypothetical protein
MWCSAHGLQKLLETFADIDGIKHLISDCKEVINFARGMGKVVAMLGEISPTKGVSKWGGTRMGALFLAMERLLQLKMHLAPCWRAKLGRVLQMVLTLRTRKYTRSFVVDFNEISET